MSCATRHCAQHATLIRTPRLETSVYASATSSTISIQGLAWTRIGSGASGMVFRDAQQPDEAIKTLPWNRQSGIPANALIEIDAMSRFIHPHVNCARSIAFDVDEERITIHQALASDNSLRQLIDAPHEAEAVEEDDDDDVRSWRDDPATCFELWRQMLSGVAELHSHRFMHGDLKPANILITRKRHGTAVVRIADLGLMQLTSGPDGIVARVAGLTERYAPWEVTRIWNKAMRYRMREPSSMDAYLSIGLHSDMFALGCIFFEMLSADARPLMDVETSDQVADWFASCYQWFTIDPWVEVVEQKRHLRQYLRHRLEQPSQGSAASPSYSNRFASTVAATNSTRTEFTRSPRNLGMSRTMNITEDVDQDQAALDERSVAGNKLRVLHRGVFQALTRTQQEHALDLLCGLVCCDPRARFTVVQAMQHPLLQTTVHRESPGSVLTEVGDSCCFRREPLDVLCNRVNDAMGLKQHIHRKHVVRRLAVRARETWLQARTFLVAVMLADRCFAHSTGNTEVSVELVVLATLRLASKYLLDLTTQFRDALQALTPELQQRLAHLEWEVVRRVDGNILPVDFWHEAATVDEMQVLCYVALHEPQVFWSTVVLGKSLSAQQLRAIARSSTAYQLQRSSSAVREPSLVLFRMLGL